MSKEHEIHSSMKSITVAAGATAEVVGSAPTRRSLAIGGCTISGYSVIKPESAPTGADDGMILHDNSGGAYWALAPLTIQEWGNAVRGPWFMRNNTSASMTLFIFETFD